VEGKKEIRLRPEVRRIHAGDANPCPLVKAELGDIRIESIASRDCLMISEGRGLLGRVSGGSHFPEHLVVYASINGGSSEGKERSNRKPLLYAVLAVLIGLSLCFYLFWKIVFAADLKWPVPFILLLLTICFLLIAYGTKLFLDVRECRIDTPQFSQEFARKLDSLSFHRLVF
jgi:hypothetical protein